MGIEEFDNISLDLPKNQSNVIKVIGVGGGGSNAISHMFSQGIKGVDYVICNTDAQALENSVVPNKIQLGVTLTEGLGAVANPAIGEKSAIESIEDIKNMLTNNTKMVFITVGMGGGTGTGAAPIIAKVAKELDILTVGIVTTPFQFEGKIRNDQAQIGIEKLRSNCDSLIVINNNKLRAVYGNLGFKAGFSKADEVLATAVRGIAEVITHHYTQNIDLRDAKTVLANSGTAIMGSATASGANRAQEAIEEALHSPLLNDNSIKGAKNVLLLIVSGVEIITIDEIGEISDHIQAEAGHSANIIMGVGEDETLEGSIAITLIATGFNTERQNEIVNTEAKKFIHTLEDEQKAEYHHISKDIAEIEVKDPIEISMVKVPSEAGVKRYSLDDYIEVEDFLIQTRPYTHSKEALEELEAKSKTNVGISQEVKPKLKKKPVIERNLSKEHLLTNLFLEKKLSNEFFRKETFLIGFMVVFMSVYLFALNEWGSPISFISIIVVLILISIKLYYIFFQREKIYNELLIKVSDSVKSVDEESPKVSDSAVLESATEGDNPIDPLNAPISKLLADRTKERQEKMKDFNYKFRNSASKIEDIDKQPAYKRMGIELDEVDSTDPNISRTSLHTDDDDIDLRSNNSFLHDNVD